MNCTIYSTNPRIRLSPDTACSPGHWWRGGRCDSEGLYNPWQLQTYLAFDGHRRTFHDTNSSGNDPTSSDVRKLSTSFYGSAVFVYGAPKRHLNQEPGLSEICIHDQCHFIWAADRYRDAIRDDQPLLLWSALNLDPSQLQVLEIRFLEADDSGRLGMTFERIDYTAEAPLSTLPRYPSNTTDLANVTFHDTNYALQYFPETDRWGRKVPNVWKKYYYLPFIKFDDTFHYTTNVGNEVSGFENRQIAFEFKGVALYIYGAPKDELERLVDGDYSHSDIEVCIDTECYPIDNHHTYLNLEGTARHLPVLLWSGNGFSPSETTHVRIRLTDIKSAAGPAKGFGLERVVYTELRPKSPVKPQYPAEDLVLDKVETVFAGQLSYEHGWWRQAQSYNGLYHWAENKLTDNHFPRWSYKARAHTIRIFGPTPQAVQDKQLAASRVCLDETCHYVDAEHIYLGVNDEDRLKDVLLWSFENLNPAENHIVSMELVDRLRDQEKRVVAVSRLEWVHTEPAFKAPDNKISEGSIILALFAVATFICVLWRKTLFAKKGDLLVSNEPPTYNTFSPGTTAGPPPYVPLPRGQ